MLHTYKAYQGERFKIGDRVRLARCGDWHESWLLKDMLVSEVILVTDDDEAYYALRCELVDEPGQTITSGEIDFKETT